MELLECIFTNQNKNSIVTLIFNKTFKKIKVMIITENEGSKSDIKQLNNDIIEIKYSKEKREVNLNIEKKEYYIFVIIEIDDNIYNKTYTIKNNIILPTTNQKSQNEDNFDLNQDNITMDQAMLYSEGVAKLFKSGMDDRIKKQCSIKNENIFAYIKRKRSPV